MSVAFQPTAFQDSSFQVSALPGGLNVAFQTCAFQFGAFQAGLCEDILPKRVGGIVSKRKKIEGRLAPVERDKESIKREREALGIIPKTASAPITKKEITALPKEVKKVIATVAKKSTKDLTVNESQLRAELKQQLQRESIAFQALHAEALAKERERLLTNEIRRLMIIAQAQEHQLNLQRSAEQRRRDEEDIAFLLMHM